MGVGGNVGSHFCIQYNLEIDAAQTIATGGLNVMMTSVGDVTFLSKEYKEEHMARAWAKAFYKSKAWEECRAAYIASVHGLCERCHAKGRLRPGKIVHHTCYLTRENINDPMVSLNFDNLEYLCQDCHNEEHHAGASTREDCMFDEQGNLISR